MGRPDGTRRRPHDSAAPEDAAPDERSTGAERLLADLRRPPRGPGLIAADALRLAGGIGVIVAALWWSATDAGVLAFVLPGLLLPRMLGARPAFDLAACAILLIAGWSNVIGLYASVAWWDLVVHFACTGVLAALLAILLARFGAVSSPDDDRGSVAGTAVVTTLVGLALGALWEMVEWFGHAFISDRIFVAYEDTIADLALGGLGAVAAGFAVARLPLTSTSAVGADDAGTDSLER
ncbi:hypothetical protein [Agromyces salentinus]|uniref:DUF2238 domain-containing protein n=1 Tax=Agromyces salentinus TaxID=269421 RepID=A0ABN2MFD9_9MICO|nr:hypothetical protein [Agromyces salentinus]